MRADETPAAELWRRTLMQIPSVFGRLVYLASLRDPNTGSYQHFGFAQQVGEKEAEKTLRRSHSNIFSDWLCFSLPEQREQVETYLCEKGAEGPRVLANWKEWLPVTNWIPPQTLPVQRDLFQSDFKTVLELIIRGNSADSRIQSASRRP
jgi:hypothetical protein